MTEPSRPLRVCDACGGVDDHPRHSFGGPVAGVFPAPTDELVDKVLGAAPEGERGRLLRELLDTSSLELHKDCCRDRGCPTGTCGQELDAVGDLRGLELRDALTERGRRLQNTES
jgi:hypothetical protein